ncbi:biotin-dependent carboxyltransferase family protein [Nitrogeniibacter mangrovi]|uniref:Biotin-dependent carboxyltransferase family protein n=1 Tax=Nitrogeniibacter mangrovi TaxID=2016596 RepID=A0A6C1B7B3_9RHOO|nr:biotin-dependent carboxyltransferase family protein [Nitrogeniibacter mangrovi]QID19601.1 biotin-dependent carboxyltransferase family protein [Nitrogeniibacter mangrovi]
MSRLHVLAPGAFASVQDAGRHGWRRAGVPRSGALDATLLRIANRLVGNADTAPAIECLDGGLRVAAEGGPVRVAVAGDARLERRDADGRTATVAPWRSVWLAPGEQLRLIDTGHGRIAMLAVAGLVCTPVLGSAATYARARLGGVDGRPLQAGDRLDATAPEGPELQLTHPPAADHGPMRVVPGPQLDHFAADALDALTARDWRVSAEADRMGMRLRGTALAHVDAGRREIVSDAIVPGAIQVPGNGQPIVLLADSQTAGGYPKIATVISADLGRLAALRPDARLRFTAVDVAGAETIAREAAAALARTLAGIGPVRGDAAVDLAALYGNNLLSGMVNALSPRMDDDAERGP